MVNMQDLINQIAKNMQAEREQAKEPVEMLLNAGKCCYFDANFWKLFQPVSMKYVRVQDNHS